MPRRRQVYVNRRMQYPVGVADRPLPDEQEPPLVYSAHNISRTPAPLLGLGRAIFSVLMTLFIGGSGRS